MNNISREKLSILILNFLTKCDKYGSELFSELLEKTQNLISVKKPTLYSCLSRMEKLGYISSYWLDSDNGGKRHYYSLTDYGQKFLQSSKDVKIDEILTENSEKNAETRINSGNCRKYDEISKVNKNDEQFIEENKSEYNNLGNSPLFLKKSLENELKTLRENNLSFSDNLKISQQDKKDDAVLLEPIAKPEIYKNEIEENKILDNYDNEIEQSKNIFQDESSFIISQDNNNDVNDELLEKDDAVFITEKLPDDLVPKVKKIDDTSLHIDSYSKIGSKLKTSEDILSTNQKIQDLYDITKVKSGKKICRTSPTENLNTKEDFILTENNLENVRNINVSQNTIQPKSLLKKHLLIFILVLIESIIFPLILHFTDISVDYFYAYIIVPVLFSIPVIYYLFTKKSKTFTKQTSLLFPIICFVLSIILIFAINMLLGMDLHSMVNFPTTFIYPCVLASNIVVNAVINRFLIKKAIGKCE